MDGRTDRGHFIISRTRPIGWREIKICERCFLCRSLELCKSCHQCPNCCYRSTCRGKAAEILGEVGSYGFESKSSNHTQTGLHPRLSVQIQFNQITNCNKQLSQAIKTGPPFGGTISAGEQKCSGTGSKLTRVLQPAIFGTQTQQPVETYLGPEHLPEHRVVQDGDPRDNKNLPTDRGVGHLQISRTHTSTYQFTVSPGSTCVFTSRVGPTSSKPYPWAFPQHPWNSQWWPKRSI